MFKDLTPIPVIDSHVHVFPQKLSDAVRHWFEEHAWDFHHQGTPEDLIQAQLTTAPRGLCF